MSRYRSRVIWGLYGLCTPSAVYGSGLLVELIPGLYLIWYPLYMLCMAPGGLLIPGQGCFTFLVVSAFWGGIGAFIGPELDRRRRKKIK